MKKDPSIFLGHILDSVELIECYCRGKTELNFYCNPPMLASRIKNTRIRLRFGQAAIIKSGDEPDG